MTEKVDRGRILSLIDTLRTITFTVQIIPFIYTVLYMISICVALSGGVTAQRIADVIFYVSPVFVVAHLIYSRILHLCVWHRTACLLPLIPTAMSVIDYFFPITTTGAILVNASFIIMFGLLLVSAYKVFICTKTRKTT